MDRSAHTSRRGSISSNPAARQCRGGPLTHPTARRWLLAASICLVCCLGLVPSAAAEVYRGKTGQDRGVEVTTDSDGYPIKAEVGWRAKCRSGRTFREKNVWDAFRDGYASINDFYGRHEYWEPRGDSLRSHVIVKVFGHVNFSVAPDGSDGYRIDKLWWYGTLFAKVHVKRRGKIVDRCRLPVIGWRTAHIGLPA